MEGSRGEKIYAFWCLKLATTNPKMSPLDLFALGHLESLKQGHTWGPAFFPQHLSAKCQGLKFEEEENLRNTWNKAGCCIGRAELVSKRSIEFIDSYRKCFLAKCGYKVTLNHFLDHSNSWRWWELKREKMIWPSWPILFRVFQMAQSLPKRSNGLLLTPHNGHSKFTASIRASELTSFAGFQRPAKIYWWPLFTLLLS